MQRVLPSPPDTTRSNGSPPPDPASLPQSTPVNATPRKRTNNRRTLSCLPCRQHKLRCDRHVPCNTCSRYRREDQCRQHPAPSAVLEATTPDSRRSRYLIAAGPAAIQSHDQNERHPRRKSLQELGAEDSPDSRGSDSAKRQCLEYMPKQKSIGGVQMARFAEHWRQLMPSSASVQQNIYSLNPPGYAPPVLLIPQDFCISTPSSPHQSPPSIDQIPRDPMDTKLFWKTQLAAVLPTQNQCDLLLCYYMENSNWLYQAVHVPSFRRQYSEFWATNVDDIDLIWLSLLFTIISISALHIPFELVEAIGFEQSTIRNLAHKWHSASRQALYAGEFESKPNLMQLQTFLVTQLYWLSTKNIEVMNSYVSDMFSFVYRTLTRVLQCFGASGKKCAGSGIRQRHPWGKLLRYRIAATSMVGLVVL